MKLSEDIKYWAGRSFQIALVLFVAYAFLTKLYYKLETYEDWISYINDIESHPYTKAYVKTFDKKSLKKSYAEAFSRPLISHIAQGYFFGNLPDEKIYHEFCSPYFPLSSDVEAMPIVEFYENTAIFINAFACDNVKGNEFEFFEILSKGLEDQEDITNFQHIEEYATYHFLYLFSDKIVVKTPALINGVMLFEEQAINVKDMRNS